MYPPNTEIYAGFYSRCPVCPLLPMLLPISRLMPEPSLPITNPQAPPTQQPPFFTLLDLVPLSRLGLKDTGPSVHLTSVIPSYFQLLAPTYPDILFSTPTLSISDLEQAKEVHMPRYHHKKKQQYEVELLSHCLLFKIGQVYRTENYLDEPRHRI